jgi:hypothetical protein
MNESPKTIDWLNGGDGFTWECPTEMVKVRHAYDRGVRARRRIDY